MQHGNVKVKVKLPHLLYVKKHMEDVEVQLHSFVTSALNLTNAGFHSSDISCSLWRETASLKTRYFFMILLTVLA
jgi:hypothetical protein